MSLSHLMFIRALSALHAGTGQGVNGIDLPIAREKATGVPYLPGSSIKGTLRDTYYSDTVSALIKEKTSRGIPMERAVKEAPEEVKADSWLNAIFGPPTTDAAEHAGAVQFADARLLLLPVRSLRGTFAYVTSPYLLERFLQDAGYTSSSASFAGLDSHLDSLKQALSAKIQGCAVQGNTLALNGKVILEDLDLEPSDDAKLPEALEGWRDELAKLALDPGERLCVVHDDVMSFLLETATEVVARIRLQDDTKTVERGGLWYEESLPAESLLYGLYLVGASRRKDFKKSPNELLAEVRKLGGRVVQFGGKATVGRGLCKVVMP